LLLAGVVLFFIALSHFRQARRQRAAAALEGNQTWRPAPAAAALVEQAVVRPEKDVVHQHAPQQHTPIKLRRRKGSGELGRHVVSNH
jgi:hypothetical protein